MTVSIKNKTTNILVKIHKQKCPMNVSCDCESIEKVEQFNYLGIILNNRLKWKTHTHYVLNKLSKVSGVIKSVKRFINIKALRTLYYKLFQSFLDYGITIWGYSYDSTLTFIRKSHTKRKSIIEDKDHHALDLKEIYVMKLIIYNKKLGKDLDYPIHSYDLRNVRHTTKIPTTDFERRQPYQIYSYLAAYVPKNILDIPYSPRFRKQIRNWIDKNRNILANTEELYTI